MGMYTGLRVDVVLKKEFVKVIEYLMSTECDDDEDPNMLEPRWGAVARKFPKYGFLKTWRYQDRSDFIPFGALRYMPWSESDPAWAHRLEGNRWVFQCSLKNHNQTIQVFLENVLRRMTEEVNQVYYLFEENEKQTHWNLHGK